MWVEQTKNLMINRNNSQQFYPLELLGKKIKILVNKTLKYFKAE